MKPVKSKPSNNLYRRNYDAIKWSTPRCLHCGRDVVKTARIDRPKEHCVWCAHNIVWA